MTDPLVMRQAIRSLRRHPSETTVLRRDGRYVRHPIRQAEPVSPPSMWKLLAQAFAVLFVFYSLFVAFLLGARP